MASVSNVLEALKYTYGTKKVLYLLNEEVPFWNYLSKQKQPLGGRGQFIMPIMNQNGGAWTGVIEGGSLPTALQPDTKEATFSLVEFVGLYNVTWKLIQDARNDKFAFQQAIQLMDESIKRRIFRNINSDLLDNGKGRLGVFSAADDNTVVNLNSLPRVEKGMVVDVMDLSDDDTKLEDSATVTAVNPVTREVTLSGAPAGTAAGDYIVIQDTTDVSISGSLHSHGILGVVDDADPAAVKGDFGGIDRATVGNEDWESVVLDNSGVNRPLTEDLLLQGMDYGREKGGTMIDSLWSNLAIGRRYHEILAGERFFALSKPGTLSGGIGRKEKSPADDGKSVYDFSGVAWHMDPYFNANVIVGLDKNHFFIGVGENEAPRPISEIFEDIPFFRQTNNTTFEVAWYFQYELLSDNPAAGVKWEDIAES